MPHPDDDTLPEVFALSGDDHDEILRDLIEITGGHCSITPERISACEGTDERKGQMLTALLYLFQDLQYRDRLHAEALAQVQSHNQALEVGRATLQRLNEELSTPLIKIGRGVLMAPLIGSIDAARATTLMERILHAVTAERARFIILDVTGVPRMDSATVGQFLRITAAIRLLGAESLLAGVQPSVAAAIAGLGVDFRGVQVVPDVEAALARCLPGG